MVKTIGVMLACYQGEHYLQEQLTSLQRQDDPNFTVLMQDDGSCDSTPALLADIAAADARFHLANEAGHHFGAVGNFLSLMAQDASDYTALCDQDDVWEVHKLSRCRAALEAAEAAYGVETPLLVHSDCRVTDADGRVLHESFFRHQGWDPTAVTLPRLLVQNNVTGCTCMMNAALRRLVVSHADAEQIHMHDWFIALTAAAFGHVIFLDDPLLRYRQHGRNVKGASQHGLTQRGVAALSAWKKGKARIALTYQQAAAFRTAYGEAMPPKARRVVDAYLATEQMNKLHRVIAVRQGGYTMQSRITRIGQMFFC